jgi:peptidoglycan/LPS O-acetylase OafA/YrhL
MKLAIRLSRLYGSALAAVLLGLAWVVPALADLDGDGFDGDELLLPLLLGAVIVVGGIAYWRSRRAPPREG